MEYIKKILSANLIRLRKSRGMTQAEVSNYIGFSQATYGRWETGVNWPDPASLEKLAEYYDIRSSAMFYDPDMPMPNQPPSQAPTNKEIAKKLQELIDFVNQE